MARPLSDSCKGAAYTRASQSRKRGHCGHKKSGMRNSRSISALGIRTWIAADASAGTAVAGTPVVGRKTGRGVVIAFGPDTGPGANGQQSTKWAPQARHMGRCKVRRRACAPDGFAERTGAFGAAECARQGSVESLQQQLTPSPSPPCMGCKKGAAQALAEQARA